MAIENLQTKADLVRFINQRFFHAQKKPYMPWWEVGVAQTDPRTLISLQGTWANSSSVGTFNTPAFYLDAEGFVHMKGSVEWRDNVNNAPDTSTIFNLPASFRPSLPYVFPAAIQMNDLPGLTNQRFQTGRLVVRASGDVDLIYKQDASLSNMITVWLDGITYRVV